MENSFYLVGQLVGILKPIAVLCAFQGRILRTRNKVSPPLNELK